MNRRSFFRTLGIATAAVYLRIAPTAVQAVPAAVPMPEWFSVTFYESDFGTVKVVSHDIFEKRAFKPLAT